METKVIKGVPMKREQAVIENMNLVRIVSKSYLVRAKRAGLDPEDLENVGAIGLLKAFDDFDDTRGIQFSTYATHKIKGELRLVTLSGHDKGIRYPANIKEVSYQIQRNNLEDEEPKHIAKTLNQSLKTVKNALEYLTNNGAISLDKKLRDKDYTENEGKKVYDLIGKKQDYTSIIVQDFLLFIRPKDKRLVQLLIEEEGNQLMVAKRLGATQQNINQKVSRMRKKLKEYLEQS